MSRPEPCKPSMLTKVTADKSLKKKSTGKRDRSDSLDIIPKKKKANVGPEPKPSSPKQASSSSDLLRSWFNQASKGDIEHLTDYLIRKRAKSCDPLASVPSTSDIKIQTSNTSKQIPKPTGRSSRSQPRVQSKITKRDIDKA